jgi:hypothetical protein
VTPKHRGTVRLREEVKTGRERFVVSGIVDPHIADQQVRVDMTPPQGEIEAVSARTDVAGRFEAAFQRPREWRADGGVFAFQAHVMGATLVAPCDSNVVLLHRDAGGR